MHAFGRVAGCRQACGAMPAHEIHPRSLRQHERPRDRPGACSKFGKRGCGTWPITTTWCARCLASWRPLRRIGRPNNSRPTFNSRSIRLAPIESCSAAIGPFVPCDRVTVAGSTRSMKSRRGSQPLRVKSCSTITRCSSTACRPTERSGTPTLPPDDNRRGRRRLDISTCFCTSDTCSASAHHSPCSSIAPLRKRAAERRCEGGPELPALCGKRRSLCETTTHEPSRAERFALYGGAICRCPTARR